MPDQDNMPDVHDDPEFHGLPMGEKHKVLMSLDADYRGLPPSEQAKALDEMHYGPAPQPTDKGTTGGWRDRLANTIDKWRGGPEKVVTGAAQRFGLPTNPDEAQHFMGQDPGQKNALMEAIDAHARAGEKSPVGYVPLLGPTAVSAAEHGKRGEYGEMLGDIGAGVATMAPFHGPGMKLADAAGKVVREPGGAMRPTLKAASEVGGAVAGAEAAKGAGGASPYIGAGIGYKAAPRLLDAVLPERAPAKTTPFRQNIERTNWTPEGEPGQGASAGTPRKSLVDDVLKVPEPRAGDNPDVGSVPRKRLLNMAQQGKPGAGEQLGKTGKSVLYTPKEGTGYPEPREKVSFARPGQGSDASAEGRPVSRKGPDSRTGTAGPKAKIGAETYSVKPVSYKNYPKGEKAAGGIHYKILDNAGKDTGATIDGGVEGNKMIIDWIGHHDDPEFTPGPRALRDVFDQLKKNHPEVETIEWNRVSGSHAERGTARGSVNEGEYWDKVGSNYTKTPLKARGRLKDDMSKSPAPPAGYKPSEKVQTMSDKPRDLGPEWDEQQWEHELQRNKSILRNPNASAEERRIAQSRIDDAESTRKERSKGNAATKKKQQ